MPGVVLYVRISIIILDNLCACGRNSPVTFGTGICTILRSNSNSGHALLIHRIDIHILPSQVVYLVSHESSGPGGRRKQG